MTFRIRWIAAGGGSVATLLFLVRSGGQSSGTNLLYFVADAAFLLSAVAGVFLTADCLSEERREGTLGLLFLSGLDGHDVVLGKLMILGLNAGMALTAVLPVLAFAWIMGGVTSGEFWRVCLALLNTLWVSLSIGLLASSWHQLQRRALLSAFLLIAVVIGGMGFIDVAKFVPKPLALSPWWCGLSPLVAFRHAPDRIFRLDSYGYWRSLWLAHGTGWLALVAASIGVRRVNVHPTRSGRRAASLAVRLGPEYGGVTVGRETKGLSPLLLDENPLLALLMSGDSTRVWVWVLVGTAMFVVVGNVLFQGPPVTPMGFDLLSSRWSVVNLPNLLLTALLVSLKLMYAWQACDFFTVCRRQNALEAILTTPISNRDIVRGLQDSLRRKFALPLTVLAIVLTLASVVHSLAGARRIGGVFWNDAAVWGSWLYTMITFPLDLAALSWMGIWFSLRDARPQWAFAKTVGLVVVLPIFLFIVPKALVAGALFGFAHKQFAKPVRSILEGNPKSETLRRTAPHGWKGRLSSEVG